MARFSVSMEDLDRGLDIEAGKGYIESRFTTAKSKLANVAIKTYVYYVKGEINGEQRNWSAMRRAVNSARKAGHSSKDVSDATQLGREVAIKLLRRHKKSVGEPL